MRRVAIPILVLTVGLSLALGWLWYRQESARERPSGGTGTVEGVEVDVVSRLTARIRAIHVDQGDSVQAGQVLVELDCERESASWEEARERVAMARAQLSRAAAQARAAGSQAQGSRHAARAAEHLAEAASVTAASIQELEAALAAQERALAAELDVARKNEARTVALSRRSVATDSELDQASGRTRSLDYQAQSTLARVREASQRRRSALAETSAAGARVQAARAQFDSLRAQAEAAFGEVEAARHAVAAAQSVARRINLDLEECRLRAPRAAVVQSRNFEPGELVTPGAAILTLVDVNDLRMTFFLPNADLADAAPGKEVELAADAYPGETFQGKILGVSPKAEFTPRNVQTREDRDRLVYAVRVKVFNREGRLRPGMPVEARIPGTRRRSGHAAGR